MKQAIESVADAVDFPTVRVRGMDDRMDDGIQSGRVTAAGVDGASFESVHAHPVKFGGYCENRKGRRGAVCRFSKARSEAVLNLPKLYCSRKATL